MSQSLVMSSRRGAIALIEIDNPPVNALSRGVRAALWEAVEAAEAEGGLTAIVIAAKGRTFPAGADIREFKSELMSPGLGDLCNRIEQCALPVVAALHGSVFGGGFEIALAAHYRIAAPGTRLGFPEINLGILPGAGGTQRAPRLAGAANPLALMLTGRPIAAASEMGKPYIDALAQGDLIEAAIEFAEVRVAAGDGPCRSLEQSTGFSDPAAFQAEIARQTKAVARAPEPARREIVRALEAAMLLPAEAGLAFEAEAFERCNASDEARGLQHLFFAERKAAKPPMDGAARNVNRLCVAGDGPLAVALAGAALKANLKVAHLSRDAAGRAALNRAIVTALDKAVEARWMTRQARRVTLKRLEQSEDAAISAGCEVVIGCGPDQARLLTETGAHAPPFACLATSTLFQLVDDSPLLGLHCDGGGRLAEILWSNQSVPEDVATLMALMRKMGRLAVAQRAVAPLSTALKAHQVALADALVTRGVAPHVIAGQAAAVGVRWPEPGARPAGLAGTPALAERDVVAFLRAGMACKGMALLRDGLLARAGDLDALAIEALGYPRWSGGPMHRAAAAGLIQLDRDIARFCDLAPDLIAPEPLLDRLIARGQGWEGLAGAKKA